MSLVLDAGAFIAYERGSRTVQAFLNRAARTGDVARTSSAVVAQVWRDGARQARLVSLLRGIEEIALSPQRARSVGTLLQRARRTDVVDASVVELAVNGDEILTSDPRNILELVNHSGKTITVTPVT